MNSKVELSRIARGKKPIYLDDRSIDNLMAMIMILTQEVSVLKDRLDTIVILLAEKETISLEDIDNFVPSDDVVMQRKETSQLLLKRILLPLEKDLEK